MNNTKSKIAIDLFQDNGKDFRLIVSNGFVFIFADVCDLTPLLSPIIKKTGNEFQISYDLLFVVLSNKEKSLPYIKERLNLLNYVGLPMILPVEFSLETITENRKVKKSLLDRMLSDLKCYCLNYNDAIDKIETNSDQFFEK